MNITVNADDLGISPGVNLAIRKAHNEGCLTHASIMTNTIYFDHAYDEVILRCPKLRIGIHLNLTYGKPLGDNIPLLTNSAGRFNRHFLGLLMAKPTNELIIQIRCEFEKQIQKALNSNITLTHIDSHEHIHFIPFINKIVLDLARKYGIHAIRQLNEDIVTTLRISGIFSLFDMNLLKFFLLKIIHRPNMVSNDSYFFSIILTGKIQKNHILNIKMMTRFKTIEVMVHPGDPEIDELAVIEHVRAKKELLSLDRKKELVACLDSTI